ncbi:MAG: hypothetical protein ACRENF_02245, partial [Thermodesulfobacteriota bacterium]
MHTDVEVIKKEISGGNFKHNGLMSLGSWRINLHADEKLYMDTLAYLFKQKIRSCVTKGKESGACLYMITRKKGSTMFGSDSILPDAGVAEWEYLEGGAATLFTGWFRIFIFREEAPVKIVIFIREPQYSHSAFEGHLFEVIHKILFMFERLYVHAAAVRWDKRVSAFVGDRGGGKSTICLKLAQEGGRIISDDHIMLKKTGNKFLVSGCEETSRVTEKTEKGILGKSLSEKPAEYNGVLKKEILLKDFFKCAHHRDFPIRNIFFT